mmetsp:Transcript_15670/g.31651  ORF Transcript_15670/g.31651 Transcript_15670/m.31651 type:complete len:513 (-) Transcript_15670:724-2262(-)
MVLDVVEGVLRHVGDARVGVLPHLTRALVRLQLAREQLDHRRLARTVGADARGARREGDTHGDAGQLRLGGGGVGEGDVGHFHDVLALGGDALERTRLREAHHELGGLQLKVRHQVGHVLGRDLGQVALKEVELELVDLQHVRAHLVEDLDVVRHDDRSHVRKGCQIIDDPLDVARVEVVSWLVEQQDVGLHQHRTHQRELHAPAAREASDLLRERGGCHVAVVDVETDGEQLLLRHLGGDAVALEALVVDHELEHRHLGQVALHVGLDKHGAQLGRWREAFDLLVGDGAHQRGLARVVAAAEAVAVAALELELRLVEQHLVAVRERELAVAQLLGVIGLFLLLLDLHVLGALLEQAGDDLVGLVVRRRQDGLERGGPLLGLEILEVKHRERHRRDVSSHRGREALDFAGQHGDAFERGEHLRELDALPDGRLVRGAAQLLVRLTANVPALGVRDLLLGTLQSRQQHGHERLDLVRVVDQLGHVLDDARAIAFGGGDGLVEAALEQRRHERE